MMCDNIILIIIKKILILMIIIILLQKVKSVVVCRTTTTRRNLLPLLYLYCWCCIMVGVEHRQCSTEEDDHSQAIEGSKAMVKSALMLIDSFFSSKTMTQIIIHVTIIF